MMSDVVPLTRSTRWHSLRLLSESVSQAALAYDERATGMDTETLDLAWGARLVQQHQEDLTTPDVPTRSEADLARRQLALGSNAFADFTAMIQSHVADLTQFSDRLANLPSELREDLEIRIAQQSNTLSRRIASFKMLLGEV